LKLRLPISSVEETIERLLPTALPLAKTKEEAMALKAACEEFHEESKLLQERLGTHDIEMKDSSFLQKWWNQVGYLQVRDSVVYNVSYFFHFKDDPTIEISKAANVQRAAAGLFATAEFRKEVCSGQLPPERVGRKKTPLCTTAYKYLFNACRIPLPEQDSYWIYDPSKHDHAIVARKNQFFAIEFVNDLGDPLPLEMVESQLEKCIEIADSLPPSRPKLGLLTSSNRDTWANTREQLIKNGGKKMEEALEILQSGAIVVNLDDEEPVSRENCGELFLSGGLSSGANRWFDKSVNLLVANNGKAGILGEHSMMDGMPVVNYASYVTKVSYADAKERSGESSASIPEVLDIFAEALGEIDRSIVESAERKGKGSVAHRKSSWSFKNLIFYFLHSVS
jgi:carnitine O-acetyltransferase